MKTVPSLDLASFRAPLWVAPPAAPPLAAPPPKPLPDPPPPPLNWQLLAITNGDGRHAAPHAMLYDPDADVIIELAAGDEHEDRRVDTIADRHVVIRRGRLSYTLSLDPLGTVRYQASGDTP